MRFDYEPVRSVRERECRDDALNVLGRLDALRLTAPKWQAVGRLLAEMDAALRSGDVDALEHAVVELELKTEPRVGRVGDPADGPPPREIRDQAVELIHTLAASAGPEADGTAKDADRVET